MGLNFYGSVSDGTQRVNTLVQKDYLKVEGCSVGGNSSSYSVVIIMWAKRIEPFYGTRNIKKITFSKEDLAFTTRHLWWCLI